LQVSLKIGARFPGSCGILRKEKPGDLLHLAIGNSAVNCVKPRKNFPPVTHSPFPISHSPQCPPNDLLASLAGRLYLPKAAAQGGNGVFVTLRPPPPLAPLEKIRLDAGTRRLNAAANFFAAFRQGKDAFRRRRFKARDGKAARGKAVIAYAGVLAEAVLKPGGIEGKAAVGEDLSAGNCRGVKRDAVTQGVNQPGLAGACPLRFGKGLSSNNAPR
jgi:hypothetical protein